MKFFSNLFNKKTKPVVQTTNNESVDSQSYADVEQTEFKINQYKSMAELAMQDIDYKSLSKTEVIQVFFQQFNIWINNTINLNFSGFYNENYSKLIQEQIESIEFMDASVFKHQRIIDQVIDNEDIKTSSFNLFAGAISLSDYTKGVLKELHAEMDRIHAASDENDKLINDIRDRINNLRFKYNSSYDQYHKNLTNLRLNFMKAVESYTMVYRAMKNN